MSVEKRFNVVTFVPDNGAGVLHLTLQSDWVISGGDRPNINVATVPAQDFDQLPATARVGTVNFYFNEDPSQGSADVSLESITIIDVQVGQMGSVLSGAGPGGGSAPIQIIDFRVSFADMRHQLIPPRGGVLMQGDVNREPSIGPTPSGGGAAALTDTFSLLLTIIDAMSPNCRVGPGIGGANLPAMRNLQWFGARAPEELSRLLQWIGGVTYVTSDGTIWVDLLGSGQSNLNINPNDLLANVPLPAIDRRGKTAVFTSAPTAAQIIYDGTGSTDPDWYWVARDTDGSWKKLADNSILSGLDPLEELQTNYADIPDQYVSQIDADLWRCLQLDPDTYDPLYNTLVKQIPNDDGYLDDLVVTAKIARQSSSDGTWANTDDTATIKVTHIIGAQGVIRLAERVVTVDPSPTIDVYGNAQLVDESDITIQFAMEAAAAGTADGKGYFACGFTRDNAGGALTALSSAEVTSALAGGDDIIILHVPAMRERRLNGQTPGVNFQDLQSKCQFLAQNVLAGSGNTYTLTVCRGFQAVEPSGVVSEIRYNQAECRTTIRQNSWFSPATAFQVDPSVASKSAASRTLASGGSASIEAHSNQSVTLDSRTAMGASGAHQPVHIVDHVPPPASLRFDCAAQIAGGTTYAGKGFYDVFVADLPLNPDPTKSLTSQISFKDKNPGLLINLGEINAGLASPAITGAANEYVFFCMAGPTLTDGPAAGKQLVWTYFECGCYRSTQYVADPAGTGNMLFQLSCLPFAKTSDASWRTALTFAPCPTT